MNLDIFFVTAFKDIVRNNWEHYSRKNENYYSRFKKLTESNFSLSK